MNWYHSCLQAATLQPHFQILRIQNLDCFLYNFQFAFRQSKSTRPNEVPLKLPHFDISEKRIKNVCVFSKQSYVRSNIIFWPSLVYYIDHISYTLLAGCQTCTSECTVFCSLWPYPRTRMSNSPYILMPAGLYKIVISFQIWAWALMCFYNFMEY